ncbi:MAG TPA: HIT family protein [Candidatus Sphingobacterium stercoripullorum]|uniref:HIT family protein n=1 Tax=Candidatus Sphingobacterium stercoripullorum TaxID=2838759 RepID=A0A9D1WAU6_9SPHI|nr:HIT family protein [Candidatus Sphingobacterium stercoripullorum]
MSTIFSKIVSGEIPSYKVAESNEYLAFLDIQPISKGHVLVIPKNPTDYIFDIQDDEYLGLWMFAKLVAQGMKKVFDCNRIGVAVVGLEVPHTHIHLLPIDKVSDMDFSLPKLSFTQEQMNQIAKDIREAVTEVTSRNA